MAYAAVVSLVQILKPLLQYSDHPYPKPQIESLYGKLSSLQSSLKKFFPVPKSRRSEVNNLETQIRDAVYRAQDTIEYLISTQISPSESEENLEEIIASVDLITREAEEIAGSMLYSRKVSQVGDFLSANALPSQSSCTSAEIVGQEKHLELLKYQLLRDEDELDVIPIVGMPGIGKTTLARSIYDDPHIISQFDVRTWVTVSDEYHVGGIFSRLFHTMEIKGQKGDVSHSMTKLGGIDLYQFLFHKSYLIVIDDIWDEEVWDTVKRFFPNRKNGSRIVLTTTMARVGEYACISNNMLQMPFLNDDESWILLRSVVFSTAESCYYQLEQLGKQIAKNCQGLPLAIIEVGKFLRHHKTVEKWKEVAEYENPLIVRKDDDTPISKTISLSYQHLPPHLKTCFLYMGAFPHKCEISISKLIKLWVSEGFLEPKQGKSLEEIAEEYLAELASRSLVILGEQSSRGRTKTCRIHFVYRNLCVSEAENQKFFYVINKLLNSFPQGTTTQRRLCIHNNNVLGLEQVQSSMKSVSAARSLLCFGPKHHEYGLQVYLHYRLLNVLDGLKIRFYKFPDEVPELVQLKYLAITYDGELPESISRLRNLTVLIVHRHRIIKWTDAAFYLPMGIWQLHKLKHLECMGFDLPDPAKGNGDGCDDTLILEKLLTLSGVSAHSCTQGILARMPNLIKLGICVESRRDGVETFSFIGDYTHLHHLESFKWVFVHPYPKSKVVFSGMTFSVELRKITLSGCGFSWEYMTHIGRLPNLEVLKLQCRAFRGPKWVTAESEFPKLRFLLLEDLDIGKWEVECDEHFPLLTRLIIRHCYRLENIPSEFIYTATLEKIEVDDCSPSLVDSAQKLRQIVGNPPLQVPIRSSWNDKTRKS